MDKNDLENMYFPYIYIPLKKMQNMKNTYCMLWNKQIGESPCSATTMQLHRTPIYQYAIEQEISDLSVHPNRYKCCSPASSSIVVCKVDLAK